MPIALRGRLVAAVLAVAVSGLSLAIWTGSSVLSSGGPGPGTYTWASIDVSAWVPAIGWVIGFVLFAVAMARRGSIRAWAGLLALLLVFSMAFMNWGTWSLGWGYKTPSECCPILQH